MSRESSDLACRYSYPPVSSLLRVGLRQDDGLDDLTADEPPDRVVAPPENPTEFLHRQIPFWLAEIHTYPLWISPPLRERSRERRPTLASAYRLVPPFLSEERSRGEGNTIRQTRNTGCGLCGTCGLCGQVRERRLLFHGVFQRWHVEFIACDAVKPRIG